MKLYRMITGKDDSAFCHRVTEALSNGWQLYGSASLSYDPVEKRTICGQAIVKDVPGQNYSASVKLSDY